MTVVNRHASKQVPAVFPDPGNHAFQSSGALSGNFASFGSRHFLWRQHFQCFRNNAGNHTFDLSVYGGGQFGNAVNQAGLACFEQKITQRFPLGDIAQVAGDVQHITFEQTDILAVDLAIGQSQR